MNRRLAVGGTLLVLLALSLLSPPVLRGEQTVADGTADALRRMAGFRFPASLEIELFAAEPQLGSPVAFCLDEQGRVFVAEQYRFNRGTEENRTRPFFLMDDLRLKTVEDRLEMYRRWAHKFDGGMDWFSRHSDQVRLLEDRDGDGRADHATVFADGFDDPLDGLAAGVLAREGNVYFTCIPNLWLLRDEDGDGRAEFRESLHYGFGVNCAFLGHDLHGLIWGPDGKLYFSVGDRGFHVRTHEGQTLSGPRQGAVFRCNADGSQLEVVHRGLRNPQELAFDKYGNLFAADNNCDKGDHARLVYVVEGGHSGWNMAYQTIEKPYLTGPWHAEKMWHLPTPEQPAWIVPCAGKLGTGPSGFACEPGLGLPDRYRDYFFMCNYTGNGGVEAFAVKPLGASFEINDYHDFLKPLRSTDVEFGYDGKMYVSDYVKLEWNAANVLGRIYTLHDPQQIDSPQIKQLTRLFREGFPQRPVEELIGLLSHPDMRARQRAQFALAEHGEEAVEPLTKLLAGSDHRLARLHAMWALEQINRHHAGAIRHVAAYVQDEDQIVRQHAIKLIGDARWQDATAMEQIVSALQDPNDRTKFFAAMALAKLGHKPALEDIFAMLAGAGDRDAYLRHAGVMALLGIGDIDRVLARRHDPNPAVRMAVLLVLRRLEDLRLVELLHDEDPRLVLEAARAINDLPLNEGFAALAALLDRLSGSHPPAAEPLLRRAINANFRLGTATAAERLAQYAESEGQPQTMRLEALAALADFAEPSPRDRVTGMLRPLDKRDPAVVRGVVERRIGRLLAATDPQVQQSVTKLVAKLNIDTDLDTFAAWLKDARRTSSARVAALQLLANRNYPQFDASLEVALSSQAPRLRAAARRILAKRAPLRAHGLLVAALNEGELVERQAALATLAELNDEPARQTIAEWLDQLLADKAPPALALDIVEAAEAIGDKTLQRRLDELGNNRPGGDPLAEYLLALEGGDPERGRDVFVGHGRAQCIRCHKVGATGGTAGPDLSQTARRNQRRQLLESIVAPNAKIAEGFGLVSVALDDGRVIAGTLVKDEPQTITLITPQGKRQVVEKSAIDEQSPPRSAMPDNMTRVLTLREIRDLVAYLSRLK